MIRIVAVFALTLLPLAGWANKTVTLMIDEAPVVQVLQMLAEQQKLNVVVAPGVQGKLSLHLVEVPWEQAFQLMLKLADLSASKVGNVLQIQPKQDPAMLRAQQEATRKQRALEQPLVQQVYMPRYADVVELAAGLKGSGEKLLGPRGNVTVDKRTNRLVVRDNKQAQKQIAAWVADMDVPMGQVELSAHIVTINREKLRELGVKWSAAEAESAPGLYQSTTVSSNLAFAAATTTLGFNIGRLNGRMLELELSALEQQHQLEIIASPRLLVAHQHSASIKQGTEIPYQVSNGKNEATSVEFKEAVLGMEVTPTISQHGSIRLKLRISQNMPGRSIQHVDGEVLTIDKQEIETQVEVQDGETLALGGIFQQQSNNTRDSVPLLGNIPLIGQLFQHEGKKRQRRELVVFITPRLIAAP
ncbi:type IV pilus secretin PilQ [Cedecea sp. FDAARGOS_727]|uniref:type IV pilus secretin PilQ n=1 Tax=Cedecea sp. FDAARGOS_727 TaxID=2545798 RepID=UPI00143E4881|nr:type IV pilus secretin PilQ [Cedecea sp. FDAARGOS_727]QIX96053.1 type IV pilus secretin PilQ [Cedecea sp. FDAARGOS_727]